MTLRKLGLPLFLLTFLSSSFPWATASAQARLDLPHPNGSHAIGSRTLVLVDNARKRDLLVTVWFPASRGSSLAPYMDQRTAAELASEWKLQTGFEQAVQSHAWADAKVEPGARFPVVLPGRLRCGTCDLYDSR